MAELRIVASSPEPDEIEPAPVRSETDDVLPSPLHMLTAAANRTNSWVREGLFTMPAVFTDVAQEYEALRQRVGISDLSSLHKYLITGAEAAAYCERLVTRHVAKLGVGGVGATALCDDDGMVIDLASIQWLDPQTLLLMTRDPHMAWLEDAAYGFKVAIDDVTDRLAVMSLAGPRTRATLGAAGIEAGVKVAPHRRLEMRYKGVDVAVSRGGSLITPSIELIVPASDGPLVWSKVVAAGRSLGIAPVGTKARDVFRIELVRPEVGRDFLNARLALHANRRRSALELGLGPIVDFGKGYFIGRRQLEPEFARGRRLAMVGLYLGDLEPVLGGRILRPKDGKTIGVLTSCVRSPALAETIALGIVVIDVAASGTHVIVEAAEADESFETRRMASAEILLGQFVPPPVEA